MSEQETFAYLSFPKIPPEKAIADYLRSKKETKSLNKSLQWDFPRAEPVMNLVTARKGLGEMENRLVEKKKEGQGKRNELNEKWAELEAETKTFRQTFFDFNKMIKENAQKRERAVKRTEKQSALQEQYDQRIKELQAKHKKLEKIKAKMEYQVTQHDLYEDYLQTIVEASPDYNTVDDVYNKFGALQETRNAITQKMDENLRQLEDYKNEILEMEKIQSSTLIGLNNHLTNLYNRYAAAKTDSEKWEDLIRQVQIESERRFVEMLKAKRNCWNVYLEMCKRKKIKPQFDLSDFENHLWYIKKTMLRLKRTLEIAYESSRPHISSVQVEGPRSKRQE